MEVRPAIGVYSGSQTARNTYNQTKTRPNEGSNPHNISFDYSGKGFTQGSDPFFLNQFSKDSPKR